MRRFEVWLDKKLAGVEPDTCIVEMPDGATDKQCDEACKEALESMIENELDTGWNEL